MKAQKATQFASAPEEAIEPHDTALGLALEYFRHGDLEQAIAYCDDVLARSPRDLEALAMSGAALLVLNRVPDAITRLQKAVAIDATRADIRSDLGLALYESSRLAEAEEMLRTALKLRSDLTHAMVNLGAVLPEQGRDEEATACLKQALDLNADIPEAYYNLSLIEVEGGQPAGALELAEQALTLKPDFAQAMHANAHALAVLGREAEAIALRRQIVARWPDDAKAHAGLALTLMHYGHLEEAAASYRRALAIDPHDGSAHRMLSTIVRHEREDDDMLAMRRLVAANDLPDTERIHLCFGLGKAYEDIGEYARAFEYFGKGNALRRDRLNYSKSESADLFAEIKRGFSPEFIAAHRQAGHADETPVFILGMPRSGTTLVEQVLAGHPDVCAAGEFTLMSRIVDRLRSSGGASRLSDWLPEASDELITRMGERYVERVRLYSSSARFITDKLPGNFLLIGLIHLAMPNAKIIHVRRDPIDTCLSIYKNYFANESLRYAYDASEIGHYYSLYLDLMEHWQTALPGVVYDISYEALVGDFQGEATRLLRHVGLDWQEGIRNFHRAPRAVQTASAAQVRRPIYATSIGQNSRVPAALIEAIQSAVGV